MIFHALSSYDVNFGLSVLCRECKEDLDSDVARRKDDIDEGESLKTAMRFYGI